MLISFFTDFHIFFSGADFPGFSDPRAHARGLALRRRKTHFHPKNHDSASFYRAKKLRPDVRFCLVARAPLPKWDIPLARNHILVIYFNL